MTGSTCVFDWCTLWNGLGLGMVASLLASALTYFIIRRREKGTYGTAEGKYKGYTYEEVERVLDGKVEVEQLRGLNLSTPISFARITYRRLNVLDITVRKAKKQTTDEDSVWSGTITMQSAESGIVVWRYVTPPRDEHHFGFKRCLVRDAGDQVWVYLLGENGYGKEVFCREKTADFWSRVRRRRRQ